MSSTTKKLELNDDRAIIIDKDIEKVFQELYDHYRRVYHRNEYLSKENERLRSEKYKDEEMAKMKEMYESMRNDYFRGFPISAEENEKIQAWMEEIIGDRPIMKIDSARFHYEFYPTALGVIGIIVDSITGQKFNFQEIG